MKSRPDLGQVLESVAASHAGACRLVVATVLRAEGSTPVDAGAKAVIGPQALIAGTIGGGAVEGEALRRAETMLQGQSAEVFDFTLQGPGGFDPRPICGGLMRVLLQPLTPSDRQAYTAAHTALARRTRGVLETLVFQNGGTTAQSRWLEAPCADHAQDCLASCRPMHIPGPDNSAAFLEPVVPRPLLLIIGAGHVGQALAAQAALAGFDLAVIDDRADLLEPDGFPDQTHILCGDIPRTVREFPVDEDTWIVLVTRGHQADATALVQCLRRPAAYLGMIGSRRKIMLMRQHFLAAELATAGEFDRVHAPIGLDIGAVTAPEIAISILAQIIAVRHGAVKSGNPRNWSDMR